MAIWWFRVQYVSVRAPILPGVLKDFLNMVFFMAFLARSNVEGGNTMHGKTA